MPVTQEEEENKMKTVFQLPVGMPKKIFDGIIEHSTREMNRLPGFLPGLYGLLAKK
jgi:hypothetical protein